MNSLWNDFYIKIISNLSKGEFSMKMPESIAPMRATAGGQPFNDVHFCFEIKHDGYRIIAFVKDGNVKLQTRNLKDYTAKFPQIVQAMQKLKFNAIFDGEIVMLDDKGVDDFNALQNWRSDNDGPLYFYAFDLLYYNGSDYMNKPLYERKNTLKNILPKSAVIIYCDEITTYGKALFKMVKDLGAEGIVAKRMDSIYRPGVRTKDWLKIKALTEEDFIVAGYTKNEGAGNLFSTLILGAYKSGVLQYVGEVGTGFSNRDQREILEKLKPIQRRKCVFPSIPSFSGRWKRKKPDQVIWCKPVVVASVKYLEKTPAGELRHQSFRRLRTDKNASEITIE
jgi:bifunctional non-homologous end joining protein LigD